MNLHCLLGIKKENVLFLKHSLLVFRKNYKLLELMKIEKVCFYIWQKDLNLISSKVLFCLSSRA